MWRNMWTENIERDWSVTSSKTIYIIYGQRDINIDLSSMYLKLSAFVYNHRQVSKAVYSTFFVLFYFYSLAI